MYVNVQKLTLEVQAVLPVIIRNILLKKPGQEQRVAVMNMQAVEVICLEITASTAKFNKLLFLMRLSQ